MLKMLSVTTALAATLVAATAAGPALAQNKVSLRFAVGANDSATDGMAMGMKALKQYAEFKSKGEIDIRIFFNTLGGSLQVTEQVKNGTLDMALTDDSVLGSFHKPMQAFQIPYLFGSSAAAWEFANTQVVRDMTEDMRKATGLRTLAFSENGFRNLTNNQREVKTPEDMKGLKMRTMQSQVYVAFMQSMGASATPISWPELIPALKTNVVDGQENASTTVLDGKLYEVQKFMSVNEHIYGFHLIIINDGVFQKLSPDHQKIMMEAARLHAALANSRKAADAITAIDEIRKKGVKVYVTSPSEKDQFRQQTQKAVIDFIAGQAGRDTVDKVLAAAKEAEKRVYGN
ncbi:MAG: TRAP transporter substrate-binding protein [Alphaproteobacteria bacterium]|nr:TRAP transporter substrate-binding protein [Alphaproteobacteria bacterium]